MLRSLFKHATTVALLAGLLLRAMTPLGYMPASPGSGLLFELCPDQLPAGFVVQDSGTTAHHHHQGDSDNASTDAEPDQCQIGHLLFSAVAADQTVAEFDAIPVIIFHSVSPVQTTSRRTASIYQPRAPPHLGNS
jgi:hypothetical protein